ncbi:hypothetical protein [Roseimicrobium sp. ORNL1]|uniref:hypothetical protein n=1 Tax=Roseimicrobium sp. ORNL1 TaxID=2711231 RepID=UPI0013E1DD86|nr:hypothetical protein [Roseimicrobium sp. ORNL1]QIF04093.1 hypothetical protein G5S37_22040 [Roseimicrobium sp. ORNL1]
MDIYLIKIYVAAGVASAAAIGAMVIDRFRNAPANTVALGAALLPWCMIAALFHWPELMALLVGLSGIISLFLFAMLFYSYDAPGRRRTFAVTLATLGLGASLYFGGTVMYPFLVTG